MKKFFLPVTLSALFLSLNAYAADTNVYTPYIGLDYTYAHLHADTVSPNNQGAAFNLGTLYNDYFGTELFVAKTADDHKNTAFGKLKTSYFAYGLDATAYLPLGCLHTFDLFASLGIGEYVFDYKLSAQSKHDNTGFGYRFGGGLLYHFSEHFSLRAAARYVNVDHVSDVRRMVEYSTGIRYHF